MPDNDSREKSGFSAGFWLAIIVIFLVLFLVIAPNFIRTGHSSRGMACQANCKNIGTALEIYSIDNGGRYPVSMSLLTPDYLKIIPTCPSAGKDTYSQTYRSTSQNPQLVNVNEYTFYCGADYHTERGYILNVIPCDRINRAYPRGYPQYNSRDGLIARP